MNKLKKLYLLFGVLVLIAFAGISDLRQSLFNKVAFGYGGGGGSDNGGSGFIISGYNSVRPRKINAINVPMTITFDQGGIISRDFDPLNSASLKVDAGTVEEQITFSIFKYDNGVYTINASNGRGDKIVFNKPVKVTLNLPLPTNLLDYRMYYFSSATRKWQRIPNVNVYSRSNEINFEIFEPGTYRFMNTGTADAINSANYGEGSLIRGSNHRIYVIVDGKKRYVRSLLELMRFFRGQKINNVPDEVLELY